MTRLFLVLIVVGAGIVGLGFYQGWFTLTVDKDKLQEDKKAAQDKVQDVENKIKDKVAGPSEKSMDGTVVSASGDKLTMTTKDGQDHSHVLAAGIKVTCDGKACKAADLKAGMRVRVTTESAAPHAVIRIEALDKNRDFDKGA